MTPTRNENWILGKFLAAANRWADHIIVADQGSTDGTLEQLYAAPTVSVVHNNSATYDERHRQCLLINRAREIEGPRVLIALDADEALSANAPDSPEWAKIESAEPGAVLRFRWVNILPGFEKAWIPDEPVAFGYVDDGREHTAMSRIHNPRLPQPAGAPLLDLKDIVVLHFQYAVPARMESKQRWYQVWEHINHPNRSVLDIFRQYNHMFGSWDASEIHPMRAEWLAGYDRAGLSFRDLECERMTWWDEDIFRLLGEHGPGRFRRLDIWKKDWTQVAIERGADPASFADPRSIWVKLAHRLLRATQSARDQASVRIFERLLRLSGW